jgi:2-polyprenyl-3-methyl-5-hydroxy-6-metoxy-1,4-benzoquinol methylase
MSKEQLEAIEAQRNAGRYGLAWLKPQRGPLFAQWIGCGKEVLDLGCRDGCLSYYYTLCNRVTGVDIDRKGLEIAAAQHIFAEVLWMDIEEPWEMRDESYDVVVAGEILEHLEHPEMVVQQAWKVLRPSGMLIGSIPNDFNWRHTLQHQPQSEDHKMRYRYGDLESLLRFFVRVEVVPIGLLKGRVLPAWVMRLMPTLTETWAFRCEKGE